VAAKGVAAQKFVSELLTAARQQLDESARREKSYADAAAAAAAATTAAAAAAAAAAASAAAASAAAASAATASASVMAAPASASLLAVAPTSGVVAATADVVATTTVTQPAAPPVPAARTDNPAADTAVSDPGVVPPRPTPVVVPVQLQVAAPAAVPTVRTAAVANMKKYIALLRKPVPAAADAIQRSVCLVVNDIAANFEAVRGRGAVVPVAPGEQGVLCGRVYAGEHGGQRA
jgi:hypothetical protein